MDGIIIINKEKNYTSNDVVQIVKKYFKQKVGHTGTLDPLATGVLPILIGKGTQLSKYLINHDKIYTATVLLGVKTDTGDITGHILDKKNVKEIKEEQILKALEEIKGKQLQTPPIYSAIKVNGKKLYEYARQGKNVQIEPRSIEVYFTKFLSYEKNNKIKFMVGCSKGTYIRTLCESFAQKLDTIGTMCELNREKVGDFDMSQTVKLDEIKEKIENKEFLEKKFISIEEFFKNEKKINLSPRSFIAFINGVKLLTDEANGIYRIYDSKNNFIGTGKVNNGILKRDIVI